MLLQKKFFFPCSSFSTSLSLSLSLSHFLCPFLFSTFSLFLLKFFSFSSQIFSVFLLNFFLCCVRVSSFPVWVWVWWVIGVVNPSNEKRKREWSTWTRATIWTKPKQSNPMVRTKPRAAVSALWNFHGRASLALPPNIIATIGNGPILNWLDLMANTLLSSLDLTTNPFLSSLWVFFESLNWVLRKKIKRKNSGF